MGNTNSPVSFSSPREWDKVLSYLDCDRNEQSVDFRSIFDALLRNLQKVKINKEVFNSLKREAPVTIPCEGFDNFHVQQKYFSDVNFREDTGVALFFEDGHKGKPDYQKMNGEPQKDCDNIITRLYENEWLEYQIHLMKGQNTISLKLKGTGSLEFRINSSKIIIDCDSNKIIEKEFEISSSDRVKNVQIYCLSGTLFLDNISFNMKKEQAKIICTSTFKESFCVYEKIKELNQDISEEEDNIIDIHPDLEFQKFKGFGGAFTESSGYVFSKLSEPLKSELINLYFSKDGLDYQFGRVPIDSCDFSLQEYSEISKLEEINDFSLERAEKYIIPFLNRATEVNGDLKLLFAPWSPPAFMKDNLQRKNGGKLKREYYEKWAEYLVSYLKKYKDKGFSIFSISTQNEPNAVQKWDSCCYSSKEEALFIGTFLGPKLESNGLENVVIVGWDHNKDKAFERSCELSKDTLAKKYLSAIGFHWYSGDHFMALSMIRKVFPSLMLISTENCVELIKSNTSNCQNGQRYAHEIIGDLNSGLNIFLDWNLLLNSSGGPNHVGNYCVSPIMTNEDFSRINLNEEYYYIMHFSKYITDATIIGSSSYTNKLEVVSFKNEVTIFVVILNCYLEQQICNIRYNKKILNIDIPGNSIITVSFKI
jgi:glucosylceramidase